MRIFILLRGAVASKERECGAAARQEFKLRVRDGLRAKNKSMILEINAQLVKIT